MNRPVRNSRPKILLVVSSYAPNFGGLQSVTATLASQLQRRGSDVTVLTHRYPRTLPADEVLNGVHVRRWFFLTPRAENLRQRRADEMQVHHVWLFARQLPE